MRVVFIVIAVVWGLSYFYRLNAQVKFNRLNVEEFQKAIAEDGVQVLDVRTDQEYKNGHIANAINMDVLSNITFKQQIEALDKTKPLYVYCRSGKRSLMALRILQKKGFVSIWDLKGGYQEWEKTHKN